MKNRIIIIIDTAIIALTIFVAAAAALIFFHRQHRQADPRRIEGPTIRVCPPRRITVAAGTLVAVAYETERRPDASGFAAPIHGEIILNGRCYSFVSGGNGRGSIPFGTYRVGAPVARPYLNPNTGHTAYQLSDAFDPIARDTRRALFIHPGRRTKGCIGAEPSQWALFERDMAVVQPRLLNLVAGDRA